MCSHHTFLRRVLRLSMSIQIRGWSTFPGKGQAVNILGLKVPRFLLHLLNSVIAERRPRKYINVCALLLEGKGYRMDLANKLHTPSLDNNPKCTLIHISYMNIHLVWVTTWIRLQDFKDDICVAAGRIYLAYDSKGAWQGFRHGTEV